MSFYANPWDKNYNRSDRDDFFASRAWSELRWIVLKRDGRVCRACGATEGQMQVDHIVPVSVDWSKRADANNLQVLCAQCNQGKGRDTYRCPVRPVQSLPNSVTINSSMIEDLRTNGSFTRATIVGLGLDYGHLKRGWIHDLIGKTVPRAIWDAARAGVGVYSGKRGKKQRKQHIHQLSP